MNSSLKSVAAVVITGLAITLSSTAHAATARDFMRGGEFCFRVGTVIPGGWSTRIKLVVSPAKGNLHHKIAHVDALERGSQATFPPNAYVMPLSGSATIAPPNEEPSGEKFLQISLTGADYGHDGNPEIRGLWSGHQALILNLDDLIGHIKGVKSFSVINNNQLGNTSQTAVDETIEPMLCSEF